jgi:hypothetical protein
MMDQILPPNLTDLELEALRQIAVHPATSNIPYRVLSRLKDIGYAKEVLGGLILTDDGLQRIAIDREHSAGRNRKPAGSRPAGFIALRAV